MSLRFDVAAHSGGLAYKLLAGLVVPRPIALVTTVDIGGNANAAPFSFFNVMGTEPPMAVFAPGDRDDGTPKDTAANLAANGECVIHLCDEAVAAMMVECARPLPPGVSEVTRAGFTTRPAERVRAPILMECPVALECRVLDIRRYGDNRLVVVEILLAHVREGVADPVTWKVDYAQYAPIGRLNSPDGYARTLDRFTLRLPSAD
jgi:flavin reductase (DIM6/NTAB) family NADH-FMN oxidoreductase RutF